MKPIVCKFHGGKNQFTFVNICRYLSSMQSVRNDIFAEVSRMLFENLYPVLVN